VSYEKVKLKVKECLDRHPDKVIEIPGRRHGSAAGLPFEEWVWKALHDPNCYLNAFLQEEFVRHIVGKLMNRHFSPDAIRNIIKRTTWWGEYVVSERQLNAALNNEEIIPVYQQSIADIIILYGEGEDIIGNLNDVLIINVKSHDVSKQSRPPNIISALRVLEFARDLLRKSQQYPDFIEKANLIFTGVYYRTEGNYAQITEVYVKDFFKLDVERMPPINFDAAIQIQWHVKDMIEKPDIDKLTFFEGLARKYLDEWQKFMKERTTQVEDLVNELKRLIEVYRKQHDLK
jgi:hypothetical protein